jgi:hypothetical protein
MHEGFGCLPTSGTAIGQHAEAPRKAFRAVQRRKDTTSHVPSQTNVQYGVSMEQVSLKIGRISHCEDLEGFALPRNLWTARAWCLSIIYGIAVKILEDSKILSGGASRGPLFCSDSNRLATAASCSMLHSQHCSQPNRLTFWEGIRKPIS